MNHDKFTTSPEAVKLRETALVFWRNYPVLDSKDTEGQKRWREFSKAAVAYAKLLLAGQCIPKEPLK